MMKKENNMDPEKACEIDKETQMQRIASYVNDEIPEGYGFLVVVFPFNNGKSTERADYVSNTNREDVVAFMKEFIAKTEESWCKHTPSEPCKYCVLERDACGKCIIEVSDSENGVYIYRDKSGKYQLVQNVLDVTGEDIICCPKCGRLLTQE